MTSFIEQHDTPEGPPRPSGVVVYNCNPGKATNEFLVSMVALTSTGTIGGFFARAGTSSLAIMRDAATQHFLDSTEGSWMLWLDDDIEFHADLVTDLLEVADALEAPIVTGVYFSPMAEGFCPLIYHVETDEIWTDTEYAEFLKTGERTIEVSRCGAGCLLVHRSVLEEMREARPDDPWYGETIHEGVKYGEDFTFCRRARRLGFPIIADTKPWLGHVKTIVMNRNMAGQISISSRLDGALNRNDSTEGESIQ